MNYWILGTMLFFFIMIFFVFDGWMDNPNDRIKTILGALLLALILTGIIALLEYVHTLLINL
jgi:hypothetical protein